MLSQEYIIFREIIHLVFGLWMKHSRREALEKQPIVSRTVKECWYEIRVVRPNITWVEIQDVFGKDLLIMLMHK